MSTPTETPPVPPERKFRRHLTWLASIVGLYLVVAYFILPMTWRVGETHKEKKEGDLADAPRVSRTANDIPGDPINLAIVGSETNLIRGMIKAGWYPADPITLESSLRIAVDSVLRRSDDQAPVSSLFLFGRKQDLAFEQPVGDNPRQRHHVRFWRWNQERDGRPVWIGSATYDERVGLSYTTGQITHHIGPDVDAERDRIAQELQKAGFVEKVEWKDHFQPQLEGRNGGGDLWKTDGRLAIVFLKSSP